MAQEKKSKETLIWSIVIILIVVIAFIVLQGKKSTTKIQNTAQNKVTPQTQSQDLSKNQLGSDNLSSIENDLNNANTNVDINPANLQ